MRLLLDEQINPEAARQLRRRGWDAVALVEVCMCGASDEQVLSCAASENRVVVTCNIADFQQLLMEWHRISRHHAGVVFVNAKSIPQKNVGGLAKALNKLLKRHAGELSDQGLFLTSKRQAEQ